MPSFADWLAKQQLNGEHYHDTLIFDAAKAVRYDGAQAFEQRLDDPAADPLFRPAVREFRMQWKKGEGRW